jgi:hypothetical protein
MSYEKVPLSGSACDYGYCDDGGEGVLGAVPRPQAVRRPAIRKPNLLYPMAMRSEGLATVTFNVRKAPGASQLVNPWIVTEKWDRGSWRRTYGLQGAVNGQTGQFPFYKWRFSIAGKCLKADGSGYRDVRGPHLTLTINDTRPRVVTLTMPSCR